MPGFEYRQAQRAAEALPWTRVQPAQEMQGFTRVPGQPRPTTNVVTRRDGTKLRYWSDGSVRRERG